MQGGQGGVVGSVVMVVMVMLLRLVPRCRVEGRGAEAPRGRRVAPSAPAVVYGCV